MNEHRWSNDHGPDELYDKFTVTQNSTGKVLGEDGEFIFVLRPERDRAAFYAMLEYADEVWVRAPNLSRQLQEKAKEIRTKNRG